MAYEQKPNWGTIWPNDFKKEDKHPDVKGDVMVERELLESLLASSQGNLIKVSIGGWAGKANGKKVLNVKISLPMDSSSDRAEPAKSDDDELPY